MIAWKTIAHHSATQPAIIGVAVGSLALCMQTMLRVPTAIWPATGLVVIYVPIILAFSFALGRAARGIAGNALGTATWSSVFVSLLSLAFTATIYRPTYTIEVPGGFEGKVRLLRSKERSNELRVNEFGIGYVCDESYRKGFNPEVVMDGEEVSGLMRNVGHGSTSYTSSDGRAQSVKYLTFTIGAEHQDVVLPPSIDSLIAISAIDTARLMITTPDTLSLREIWQRRTVAP